MKNRFISSVVGSGFFLVLFSVIASNYLTGQKSQTTPRWLDSLSNKPEDFATKEFFNFLENQDTIVLSPRLSLPEQQDMTSHVVSTTPVENEKLNVLLPINGQTSINDLTGEELFQHLHNVTAPGIDAPMYSEAKAYMYSKVSRVICNDKPGIITFYSQICVNGDSNNGNDYKEDGDMNKDGVIDKFVNAEHIWPRTYFKESYPMISDLHNLFPTFATPNARRANLPFANVAKFVYSTSCGSKLGADGFEPCDLVKGDTARAILYFIVRYYDQDIRSGMDYKNFWTDRVPMFLQWNRQDPPDANERKRNDLIEQFQGNRNPFIDDPSLADKIGKEVFMSH